MVSSFIVFIAMSTSYANATTGKKESKEPEILGYKIKTEIVRSGYDGMTCWVHPRAGAIPGARVDGKPAM